MRIPWLCSLAVLYATAAFAQTSASPTPSLSNDTQKTISVTGCVVGGSKSEAVTLTQAMVLPFGSPAISPEPASAAEPPAVLPQTSQVSAGATQQRPTQQRATPPSTRSATPGAVGTSGTIVGTAPAGSSASTIDGYRLSGADMSSWIGRRVQIIGTLEPAKPPTQPVAVDSSERIAPAAMPEIRVLGVQPVTGSCTK